MWSARSFQPSPGHTPLPAPVTRTARRIQVAHLLPGWRVLPDKSSEKSVANQHRVWSQCRCKEGIANQIWRRNPTAKCSATERGGMTARGPALPHYGQHRGRLKLNSLRNLEISDPSAMASILQANKTQLFPKFDRAKLCKRSRHFPVKPTPACSPQLSIW